MGRYSQICGLDSQTATTNSKNEVDRAAWAFASAKLSAMPFASAEDLRAAAVSYLGQSIRDQGGSGLFSAEVVQRKADKLAGWWHIKHTANSTKRQHTRYTAAQGKRGRVVSQYRRGRQSDVLGLRVQLAAKRGAEVSSIAEALGITPQHARRLKRRRFALVLVLALVGTFGKNSVGSPSKLVSRDKEKLLPNVRHDVGGAETGPDVANIDQERDRIDQMGANIGAILRDHWEEWPALPSP